MQTGKPDLIRRPPERQTMSVPETPTAWPNARVVAPRPLLSSGFPGQFSRAGPVASYQSIGCSSVGTQTDFTSVNISTAKKPFSRP